MTIDAIEHKYRIHDFSPLQRGDTSAPLFKGTDSNNKEVVIKLGSNRVSREEVYNNYRGYKILGKYCRDIVPTGLRHLEENGVSAIMMEYLGANFRGMPNEIRSYPVFLRSYEKIVSDTATDVDQKKGISFVLDRIEYWYGKLFDGGLISKRLKFDKGLAERLTGGRSSLMSLDFTPDNVFLINKQIKLIDPWIQTTYLGTPIVPLAIFIGLATSIYRLPGASAQREAFVKTSMQIGAHLGMDRGNIAKHFELGEALQNGLSAYVRIGKNPKRARNLAEIGMSKLSTFT